MRFKGNILILGLIIGIVACKPKATITDEDGNTIQLEVSNIEWTTKDKEEQKDKVIIEEINSFLENNKSDAVTNYLYLCDSSMISPLRDFNVFHKKENIHIGLGKNEVQLSPIPGVYKVSEGPYAKYKVHGDSFELVSYFIDIKLDKEFKVIDFIATLRYYIKNDGDEKVFVKKEIYPNDKYLIERRINANR